MGNPSTIWAQLSIPNSPIGSAPYVANDGQSIITDVADYQYIDPTMTALAGYQLPYQLTVTNGLRVSYSDVTSAPGTTYTINKSAGRLIIPGGTATVTVTCANCFTTSIVRLQMETNDATLTRVIPTPTAGGFTITGNANATGAVKVTFDILNVR